MLKALRRVRAGQLPAASQQNEQTSAIEGLRNMSGFGGAQVSIAEFGVSLEGDSFIQLTVIGRIIDAINATGDDTEQDVYPGDVVQIGQLPNDTDEINEVLKDQTPEFDIPTAEGGMDNIGIVIDGIPRRSTGRVMTSGYTFVKVIREDSEDEFTFAKAVDGETTLTMSGFGVARVLWEQDIADPTQEHWAWVELMSSNSGTSENPFELGSSGETEAASTDEWDKEDPPEDTDGVAFTCLSRIAYDDSGDEKLYGYYSVMTFDSRGLLVSIGPESRVIIDTPEDC